MKARDLLRRKRVLPVVIAGSFGTACYGMFADGHVQLADIKVLGLMIFLASVVTLGVREAVIPLRDLAREFYDNGRRDERKLARERGVVTRLRVVAGGKPDSSKAVVGS